MKVAVITCARKNSQRLPNKNHKLLFNKPLIQYTLDVMEFLKTNVNSNYEFYTISDCAIIKSIVERTSIKFIEEPEKYAKNDSDGMELMRWIHKKIDATHYFLLPPTFPIRNNYEILNHLEWIIECSNIMSAASVYKKNRNEYILNGNFFYYHKDQLNKTDLIDYNTHLLPDKYNFDIDTLENFNKAEQFLKYMQEVIYED